MSPGVFVLEADNISTAQQYYKGNRYITNIMFELQKIA